jgi:hypothetical protein
MLAAYHLKLWRQHVWLYPKQPRDAAFYATVSELIALYAQPLHHHGTRPACSVALDEFPPQ